MKKLTDADLSALRESIICNLCRADRTAHLYTIDSQDLLLSTLWVDGAEQDVHSRESIVRCTTCGLVYVNPRLKMDAAIDRYSEQAETDYFTQTYPQRLQAYQRFIATLPQWLGHNPETLLDIGCGDGVLIEAGQAAGIRCAATETREPLCRQVRDRLGAKSIVPADLAQLAPEAYSVVTLLNVIEHLYDPKAMLEEIHRIVEQNGLFFVHAPNFGGLAARVRREQWNQIDPFEHFYYFTYQTLSELLVQCGFEPIGRFSLLTASGIKDTLQRVLNRANIYIDNGLGIVSRRVD